MSSRVTRRQALIGASSALLLPVSTRSWSRMPEPDEAFAHGVASGDPDHRSVVLWTRVSGHDSAVDVHWAIASDPAMRMVVDSGRLSTDARRDFTCKVVANNLSPGHQYFYCFEVKGKRSVVGRTRTLPVGHLNRLGIAVASCSNFPFGYFNAYEAIANDDTVDFVLHLGDYIYEYGPDGYGGSTGYKLERVHEPRHEIQTLNDYRTRHAQYKGDVQSQMMHSAHPMIAIWDDHETTNNPWLGGAQNHQPQQEGDWATRRAASLQAYYEWMPVREPHHGHSQTERWQHYRFGDLASLVTLETRHTSRAEQIDYDDFKDKINDYADAQRFQKEVLGASGRNLLSDRMESFLADALRESVNEARPWRLIGNQIPMARTHGPKLDHPLFAERSGDASNPINSALAYLKRIGELDLPIYLDPWDGYGWAREKFYTLCQGCGVQDLLVLTGDSHSFWSNALFDGRGKAMGLELGTSGITSPGDFIGFGIEGAKLMDSLLAEHNEEVVWTDCLHNGYVRLQLTHDGALADYLSVTDILTTDYNVETLRSINIVKSAESLRFS